VNVALSCWVACWSETRFSARLFEAGVADLLFFGLVGADLNDTCFVAFVLVRGMSASAPGADLDRLSVICCSMVTSAPLD